MTKQAGGGGGGGVTTMAARNENKTAEWTIVWKSNSQSSAETRACGTNSDMAKNERYFVHVRSPP